MNQQQQQSGEQQPRQQPLYDISQGGHYGKCAASTYSNNPIVYAVTARDCDSRLFELETVRLT